jgi:hypothetical protein
VEIELVITDSKSFVLERTSLDVLHLVFGGVGAVCGNLVAKPMVVI